MGGTHHPAPPQPKKTTRVPSHDQPSFDRKPGNTIVGASAYAPNEYHNHAYGDAPTSPSVYHTEHFAAIYNPRRALPIVSSSTLDTLLILHI